MGRDEGVKRKPKGARRVALISSRVAGSFCLCSEVQGNLDRGSQIQPLATRKFCRTSQDTVLGRNSQRELDSMARDDKSGRVGIRRKWRLTQPQRGRNCLSLKPT